MHHEHHAGCGHELNHHQHIHLGDLCLAGACNHIEHRQPDAIMQHHLYAEMFEPEASQPTVNNTAKKTKKKKLSLGWLALGLEA